MILAGTLTAQAADYQYLTIEKSDGTATSLTAVGLNISYSDTQLTATNGQETATFTLSEVSRMYFSNTKQGTATGISEATAEDWNDTATEIFDLSGRQLPQGKKPARGLYIFKKGNTTIKKHVK